MATNYNAVVDVGRVDPADSILDALADYHAVLAGTPHGTIEVVLTFPAENLRQAASTALAVVEGAGVVPAALHVLTTADFDAGIGFSGTPETMSVAEVAKELGVTTSAVRQRLAAGTLPGRRVGRDWQVPRAVVANLKRS